MTTKYCDRAFISINGAPIVDLESATLKMNQNAKAVPVMTRDRYNLGFVQGNIDIDISVVIAVRNLLASPKLEAIDYETNDVQITYVSGADVYVATGVYLKDSDVNASGVGSEIKKTYNFGALKVTDAIGNSSLFNLSL